MDESEACDWLVWQLADSAFPSGGFAHSGGLEAAWQLGEISERSELVSYMDAAMEQASCGALRLVLATLEEPARAGEFDRIAEAFLTNHVSNRASRSQGKALMAAMGRIFIRSHPPSVQENTVPLPFCHLSTVFGFWLHRLGIPQRSAARLFMFHQLRGLIAAAVRLGAIGPMDGQLLQHSFAKRADSLSRQTSMKSIADLTQITPLIDLWQGAQDQLYSRLFQS
ncbi:MAG: urease accessory protein UreF [Verrucomicrobia bacterium]|nr:urease accessory protein UreF [Verrucomicrobiota bacterium]